MNNDIEQFFICPACGGNMKFVKYDHNEFRPQCIVCKEMFTAEYVRGFAAGYEKGKRDA